MIPPEIRDDGLPVFGPASQPWIFAKIVGDTIRVVVTAGDDKPACVATLTAMQAETLARWLGSFSAELKQRGVT